MQYPSTHKSLLLKIRSGDEVSWNEFYERYAPIVRYVGRLYRFGDAECDDLVQNVMLKFFNAAGQFVYREGEVRFRTYFAAIIRSQAVDHIRKNARRELPPAETEADPFAAEFMRQWRQTMLAEALDELRNRVDASTYQAFELYALQQRRPADVATALGVSKAQLYVAKSRCLKLLQQIISRYNAGDGELHLEL